MPVSTDLAALEARRNELRQELATLGDLRPGSLLSRHQKCGKATCCCAADDHPGHGPYWLLVGVGGAGRKTTRSIPAHAVDRTRAQIAEYKRFRDLSREFLQVSEAICQVQLARARGTSAGAGKNLGRSSSRSGARRRSTAC